MTYEDIYSRSYIKKYDPEFFTDKKFAYSTMKEWLHEIAAIPYVNQAFKSLVLDDDMEEITYELNKSKDEVQDDDFVKKIFSDGFIICWMRPKVESVVNTVLIIGGKDEKRLQSNYSVNIDRLESLEIKLKKYIRDYGYFNGTYGTEV